MNTGLQRGEGLRLAAVGGRKVREWLLSSNRVKGGDLKSNVQLGRFPDPNSAARLGGRQTHLEPVV